jgi:hypothetical protein
MSDAVIGIEVTANTGAATRAMRDLEDATRAATDAADNAGEGQKTLAQKAAGAKEATLAAAEASRRSQAALAEHNATVAAHGRESKEAAASLARLKAAQAEAAKQSAVAEQALSAVAEETAKAVRESDKLTPALARVAREVKQTGAQAERTASEVRRMELAITAAGKAGDNAGKGLAGFVSSFTGNLAANAVSSLAGKLGEVGLHALDTAANFERMKTALATTLGGTEAASAAFAQLQAFAAATPYSLEEVTNGFLKLKARGLDGSDRALRAWGDTASAMGKSLDDMVEAVADATTGEFERLKEFGIRASSQGDKVALTFRGVTTTVAKEAKAIEAELMRLGEVNFAGGMEAQSRTLGGLWSTMKDGFDQFLVAVMDSGITSALKSLMGTFSGMSETGEFLSDLLGLTLGGAFTAVSMTAKVAAEAIELFFTAVNAILSPVYMAKDAIESLARDSMTSIVAETEKLVEAQKELDRQYWESAKGTGTLAADMQGLIDLSGKYALSIAAEGLAHLEAANAADRRMKAEADLWGKMEARNAKAEDKAIEDAFFAQNEMGPQLPPGFKREKKKGKKKPDLSGQGMEAAKRFEMETRREREQAFAAEVAVFEQESAAREKTIDSIGRELDMLEKRKDLQAESIDMVFYTVDVESEAAARREALIDAQIEKELELARWQVKNARSKEQRERATTRLEAAEHAARVRSMEKLVADEEKAHRKRQKVVESVSGAVMTLGEGMVDAFQRMADGEKGAVASMIAELLRGIAKKHTILALGEAALAVGAAATTWGIPNPASIAHATAAAMHGGVAIAAGVGAFAAGKIADARGGGGGSEGGGGGGGAGGARGSGGERVGRAGRESEGDDLQAQEVPVTHEQLRRADPSLNRSGGGGVVVNIYSPTIAGAGGVRELATTIQREIERNNRGGRRPRS